MRLTYHSIIAMGLFSFFSCSKPEPVPHDVYSKNYFYKNGGIAFYKPSNVFNVYVPVKGADKTSFEVIHALVGKDKQHIYYQEYQQPQVDYESFRFDKGYLKDKNHVYKKDRKTLKPIENSDIDPESFESLDWDHYRNSRYWSKDKAHYYFKNETLAVDYETFQQINASFLADKDSLYTHLVHWKFMSLGKKQQLNVLNDYTVFNHDSIYYVSNEIEGRIKSYPVAPGSDITSIADAIIRVNNLILFHGEPFTPKGYDAASFAYIGENKFGGQKLFTKDKNQVYMNQDIIPDADPATFELITITVNHNNITTQFSKDKNAVFYQNQKLPNANPTTIQHVGGQYIKDDKHVYFQNTILLGADPETFKRHPKDALRYEDKNGSWNIFGEEDKRL